MQSVTMDRTVGRGGGAGEAVATGSFSSWLGKVGDLKRKKGRGKNPLRFVKQFCTSVVAKVVIDSYVK